MPIPVLLMNRSLNHGGTERQTVATAMGLDRAKFTPHVAFVEDGFRAEELRKAQVPLLQLPLNSYFNATTWTSARQLRDYIKAHQIRLVHTFDHSISIFGVPAASMIPGVRVLSSQRFYFSLLTTRHRWMLHAAHRMARGIVVNAEAIRRHLVDEYGYNAGKIQVCHNSIDETQFVPEPRRRVAEADFPVVVGVVCVLRPEKNLGMLLDAFAQVTKGRGGEVGLLLVGSGPEREMLVEKARQLGIADRCRFLPSTATVSDYMRGIDIFVHPSLSEGLPNAVMEAMACGCCVLASDVGGSREVVIDGESGLLFPPDDLAALVSRLQLVIEDAAFRQRLAHAATERVRTHFTTQRAAQRMGAIYLSTLD
jgi:glycosyltransferase involved in cell wall biosynthesis